MDGRLLTNAQSVGQKLRPVVDFGKISITLTLAFGLADAEYKFPVIVASFGDKDVDILYLTKSEIIELSTNPGVGWIELDRRDDDRRWHDRFTGNQNDPRKS
jgi:hypothetical protein